MIDPRTGKTVAELEKLSRETQARIAAGMPKEGQIFQVPSGEGATQLATFQGGQITRLGFEYPQDWGGRTIGSWQKAQTSKGIAALGIDVPTINVADYTSWLREQGIKETSITDVGQFTGLVGQQPISPIVPEKLVPEDTLAGIRSVFGQEWVPAPAFQDLQNKGIFGAVRIAGSPNVFTLGKGGRLETPESFMAKFGTLEQEGIVGEISKEQALKLGITDTAQTPVAPAGITPDSLADQTGLEIDTDIQDEGTNANVTAAGIQNDVETYKSEKSAREKELEEEVSDITTEMKDLLGDTTGRGAAQLTAEEEEEVKLKQEATDDAYAEVDIKLAEIAALEADYRLKNQIIEGKAITMGSIIGEQAQQYKMYLAQKNVLTSEASMLDAKALALQGKTDRAQKAADRSVDLKYADIEQEFNSKLALYEIVKGELTDEQNIRLEALEAYTLQQKEALADQKAVEKADRGVLLGLISKYGDAGIDITNPNENATTAWDKIRANSKIYQTQTRLAGVSGVEPTEVKISSTNRNLLVGAGFTSDIIDGIQSDLSAGNSLDDVVAQLKRENEDISRAQITTLTNVFTGITPTQAAKLEEEEKEFLSKDYFSGLYNEDQLKKSAKEAGFRSVWTKWETEKDDYLNYLMDSVDKYREAGFSDKEILKEMQ